MAAEENSELWPKAVFGRQVEEFLCSDIGKYLLDKAARDWESAVNGLRNCKPEDVYRFQADMKRAESIRMWLATAVDEGLQALDLIKSGDEQNEIE